MVHFWLVRTWTIYPESTVFHFKRGTKLKIAEVTLRGSKKVQDAGLEANPLTDDCLLYLFATSASKWSWSIWMGSRFRYEWKDGGCGEGKRWKDEPRKIWVWFSTTLTACFIGESPRVKLILGICQTIKNQRGKFKRRACIKLYSFPYKTNCVYFTAINEAFGTFTFPLLRGETWDRAILFQSCLALPPLKYLAW